MRVGRWQIRMFHEMSSLPEFKTLGERLMSAEEMRSRYDGTELSALLLSREKWQRLGLPHLWEGVKKKPRVMKATSCALCRRHGRMGTAGLCNQEGLCLLADAGSRKGCGEGSLWWHAQFSARSDNRRKFMRARSCLLKRFDRAIVRELKGLKSES